MPLTAREAAEYSNIGINKIDSMLRSPNCPFVLSSGRKKLVKRREFEEYISPKLVIWQQKIICKNSLREKNLSAIIMSLQWALFLSAGKEYTTGKNLKGKECGKSPGWSCVVLSLSTGVPGNRRKTVPMIPTFTSYATKQELKNSVCTLYATPMQCVQSKAGCSQKVLQKLLGHASIKTTMDRYVHVTSESLDQAVRQFESGRVSWHISPCENGVKMA